MQSHSAKSWKRDTVAPAVLLLMVIGFCSEFLFGDGVLLLPDLFSLEMPGYIFYRESLLAGSLPLWTPYSGCGEPYLAGSDIGVFYPPNLIFLFLSLRDGIAVFVAFHLLLCGIATYVLSRLWGVSRLGSLLAAIAFAFGSWTITRIEFVSSLASVAWFPLCLAVFAYWLNRPSVRAVFLLAGCLAMGLLAGWPEGSFYTGGSLVVFGTIAGVLQFRVSRRWRDACTPLCVVLFAGFLAVLLSAVQILPTWEAVQLSQRSDVFDSGVDSASVDPFMLFGLLIPSIYGMPVARHTGGYWAPSCVEYYHGTFYIGVLPIVLLLMALGAFVDSRIKRGPHRPRLDGRAAGVRTAFLIALAAVSLLYAMGKYTPVFPFLWTVVPVIQKFHAPSKSLMCFVLATSCLAGVGLDYLACCGKRPNTAKRFVQGPLVHCVAVLVAALGLLFVVFCLSNGGKTARDLYVWLSSVDRELAGTIPWQSLGFDAIKFSILAVVSAFLLWLFASRVAARGQVGWAIVGILFLDLWITNSPLMITGENDNINIEQPSELLSELQPEGRMVRFYRPIRGHGLYGETDARLFRRARNTLRGWWSTVDRAYNLNQAGPFRPNSVRHVLDILSDASVPERHKLRLLAMLNCERVVPEHEEPLYVTGRIDRLIVDRLQRSHPRAYVVGGVRVLRDSEAVLHELRFGEFDPMAVALIARDDVAGREMQGLSPGRIRHEIRGIQDSPNRLEIRVQSAQPGVLTVSDTFFPGWTAEVNGIASPLIQVNGGFRGVQIPAGQSTINMVYRPQSLKLGAAISLLTLFIVVAFGIGLGRKPSTKD